MSIRAFAAVTLVAAGIYVMGRTYGATHAECTAELPGDRVVTEPTVVCTHATTIDAAPDMVWPWLVQVGWHRGGWYTARWVDRLLFPDNLASANRLIPELQRLQVGDFIPDGAPETECGFIVLDLVPQTHLLLGSTTHLPLSWRRRDLARLEWTWVFILRPIAGEGRTRFIFRWRASTDPWWMRLAAHLLVVPADAVMSRAMLRGVRRRAERVPARQVDVVGPTITA